MPKPRYTIAHIMPYTAVGGTEQATLRIAQAVEGQEFRNVMFCREDSPLVSDFFQRAGFETTNYFGSEPSDRHWQPYIRPTIKLIKEVKRQKVDLIHAADVPAGVDAAWAGRLLGRPVICQVRNRYEWLSRSERVGLLAVSKFVFVSRDTWRRFCSLARFGSDLAKGRGTVVYDGIDIEVQPEDCGQYCAVKQVVRTEFRIPETATIVGMVARVSPQKDYATLARAAAQVVAVNPQVRFLIVGSYSKNDEHRAHYDEVQRILAANDVTPYFIFTDFREDVGRLIAAMDIFVLSTHFEGLPLVILEAMAQGKPVVATAVDGIPEIVLDRKTGLLHAHADAQQLGSNLLSLIQDEALRVQLGKAGREHVKANFNKEQFALNMRRLYRDTLGIK